MSRNHRVWDCLLVVWSSVALAASGQIPKTTGTVTGTVVSETGQPAVGVRVYAIAVREPGEGIGATILAAIGQTDAAGRYRLEIPPGRYTIGAGSVDSPTYFPGTTDPKAARVLLVSSDALTESVNFSGRLVPPLLSPQLGTALGLNAIATVSGGTLSGTVRLSGGGPAAGVLVTLTPAAVVAGTAPAVEGAFERQNRNGPKGSQEIVVERRASANRPILSGTPTIRFAQTDSSGRYQLGDVLPGTYHIMAGFADAPVFYPNARDVAAATPVISTSGTKIDNLDLTLGSTPPGTTLRGRALVDGGLPFPGGEVILLPKMVTGDYFLSGKPAMRVPISPDGSFEISNVPRGAYVVEARLPSDSFLSDEIIVGAANPPLANIDIPFPAAVLTGRVLGEDGNPFPNPSAIGSIAITTVKNPNLALTTLMRIADDGTFGRIVGNDEYRIQIYPLSGKYAIHSISSGSAVLTRDTLQITPASSPTIEIRITH